MSWFLFANLLQSYQSTKTLFDFNTILTQNEPDTATPDTYLTLYN